MNKDQLDNLALQCWGGDLVCYKYFDHHKFLALVDAERAKEGPVAWMFTDNEDDNHKSFRQTPPTRLAIVRAAASIGKEKP